MATSSLSLREHQIQSLKTLLSFNNPNQHPTTTTTESNPSSLPPWKVLILDQRSQDILATTLIVQDLRALGVTLHMQLNTDRPPLPDVPAIYFVSPTRDSIKRIGADLEKGLYENFYLNFTSTLPRPLLEELASLVIDTGADASVEQVSVVNEHNQSMNLSDLLLC